jgi:hypothetical protein
MGFLEFVVNAIGATAVSYFIDLFYAKKPE